MKHIQCRTFITGVMMGAFVLGAVLPADAAPSLTGISQEQLGRAIKGGAWLRWNAGRVQQAMGTFIVEGATRGQMPQEAMGGAIAAASHLRSESMKSETQLGTSILNSAQISNAAILDQESERAVVQTRMGQEIQTTAQNAWIMGSMVKAAYASLGGDFSQQIPQNMIAQLRRNKAFGQEANFRLAMTLLGNERGAVMTPRFEATTTGSTQASPVSAAQTGGFWEFGFMAVAGFLYAGWTLASSASKLSIPQDVEEKEFFPFQEAA